MEHNWALDGGSSEEAFDAWNEDMIENGNVPEGFDWREHATSPASTRCRRSSAWRPTLTCEDVAEVHRTST